MVARFSSIDGTVMAKFLFIHRESTLSRAKASNDKGPKNG